ncbi:hypothetical protein LCGC14_0450860 [marine sediment metagenome]|uniref:Uncharacterized protein n=1 Tax=marine sediment metagenome TaxID=412755 RepID=A0A0F9SHP8_9ZZZZ
MPEPVGSLTWSKTDIAMEALEQRNAMFFMKTRIIDKSRLVTGKKFQQIDIPEVLDVITNRIGDLGGVTPQKENPSSVSLIINQPREATRDFPDAEDVQLSFDNQRAFVRKAGVAHGQFIEDTILALETGNTNRIDVPTDLTDILILQAKVALDAADVPQMRRFLYVSPGQQGAILLIDKFVNIRFIGFGIRPEATPTQTGFLQTIYGAEPLMGTRVRRRDVGGTVRTINFMFQEEAYAIGVQKDMTTVITREDLAKRIILWNLFGVVRTRDDHVQILQSENA